MLILMKPNVIDNLWRMKKRLLKRTITCKIKPVSIQAATQKKNKIVFKMDNRLMQVKSIADC